MSPVRDPARGAGSSRAAQAAGRLAALAEQSEPGARLGSKDDLRARCAVSVGTFNESLRLLQARGVITVRPGPGGGIFAARQSPMVRLGNSVLALDGAETDVAGAIRIRDALDPLLIEDALWHASPADIASMRERLEEMREAADASDPTAFTHANWRLHARIAATSPDELLRSLYTNLLDLVETHTLRVLPRTDDDQPLAPYVRARYELHRELVDALERRDREEAMRLVRQHASSPNSS